ncbi:MAG TPA: penicillin-binding protein [Candidatus Limnocylindrales bacterium]|nr:penicillin-binding protein [Candidatus Limnocylindrales bacterium]
MRKRDHGFFTNTASLLICGVLAGVVVAAALFPVVAFSGLAAKAGGEAFGQLPDELTVKRTPQISYVYASDDKTLLATMYDENRRDLPLSEIPLIVQRAMLAAEDQKFYEHNGVDVKGFARAFIANQTAGEVSQGASTITMQLVRMSLTFTSSPPGVLKATEDTNTRKLREVRYAVALEQRMSKDQILESYLNTAYFGLRSYGIYAASQVYFNRVPAELTLSQTAFIVGLVKAPGDVEKPEGLEKAMTRRDYVIDEMLGLNYITQEQAIAAKAEKLEVVGNETPNGCVQTTVAHWGFFCDFFQRWWLQQDVFGTTTYDRERQLRAGGYRITTSLDIQTQDVMKANIEKQLPTGSPHAMMLAAVEPGTGKVRAMGVNRNFRLDSRDHPQNGPHTNPVLRAAGFRGSYPNTTNPLMSTDPSFQGYRPGSVMKTYAMVAALEKGYPLDYTINTQSTYQSKYPISRGTGNAPTCGGYWCPPVYDNSPTGPQNMWTAFGYSVNTYFVPLFDRTGGLAVMDVARRFGLTFYNVPDNPADRDGEGTKDDDYRNSTNSRIANVWSPFVLGISTHPPVQIANTWATLAADGLFCEPLPVEAIANHRGEKLGVGNPRCEQRFSEDVARAAIDAGRCPVGDKSFFGAGPRGECDGSGTARPSYGIIQHPISGKTGTADGEKSSTLTITTKQLAVSGFVTDPDWPETTAHMEHNGPGGINPAVQGTLRDALAGKPAIQFTKPSDKMAYGDQVGIPNVACKSVAEATSILRRAGFKVEVNNRAPVASTCAPGSVAGTSPSGRTIKGGSVSLLISAGNGGGGGGGPGPRPTCRPPLCRTLDEAPV